MQLIPFLSRDIKVDSNYSLFNAYSDTHRNTGLGNKWVTRIFSGKRRGDGKCLATWSNLVFSLVCFKVRLSTIGFLMTGQWVNGSWYLYLFHWQERRKVKKMSIKVCDFFDQIRCVIFDVVCVTCNMFTLTCGAVYLNDSCSSPLFTPRSLYQRFSYGACETLWQVSCVLRPGTYF